MGLRTPPYCVVSVGGTNGKGSSVAMLDAILRAAGYRVGTYTSPHLRRYNERVRLAGVPVEDGRLCEAFERVDRARGLTSLTYFEFGTLAALDIFQRSDLEVGVLEVGLGGRLDAVNLVDADAALITAIGIDHVEWLGAEREDIAREKAGILRAGRPAICSDPDVPVAIVEQARRLGAPLYCPGGEYRYTMDGHHWSWAYGARSLERLPRPALLGEYQVQNAAGVLMVLEVLAGRLPVTEQAIRHGLVDLRLCGRFQVVPGAVEQILDVAHNPQAAGVLAAALRQRPVRGATHAVIGMLKDKDCRGVLAALRGLVDAWYFVDLPGSRGATGRYLAEELSAMGIVAPASDYRDIGAALEAARSRTRPGDRILITGSFLTVAGALALVDPDPEVAL